MPIEVLVLLAHNDDEYFVSARIQREVSLGNRVHVAYTTHGSMYGTSDDVRQAESSRALEVLGVHPSQVHLFGLALDVHDGSAAASAMRLVGACTEAFRGVTIDRLIAPAWEGGHPDHDATHLIAVCLAHEWGLRDEVYDFPLYTQAGAPHPLFRVHWYPAERPGVESVHLNVAERLRYLLLARYYRSQWRSFLGLLPEAVIRFGFSGVQLIRRVDMHGIDYSCRPHDGVLFYERRFGTSFAAFRSQASSLLGCLAGPGESSKTLGEAPMRSE